MKKKVLFVYNQHSGKGQIKTKLAGIIDIFTKAGYELTVHPTQARGDATEIVEERIKDFDLLICSGGDGTLDEAVNGMMRQEHRVPIGYIPAGSTNDFAVGLRIPSKMLEAAKAITQENRFACDIGSFNGNSFVYIAAFGLFTDVSYETNQQMKNVLGHLAYVLESAKRLPSIKDYHVEVVGDGEHYDGDYMYGMVTNARSVGGFKNITGKNVEFDDGLFEVTLIKKPRNPVELSHILAAILGNHPDEMICSFKARRVEVYSDSPIAWTLDGEFGGNHTQVEIQNVNKGVEFLIPLPKGETVSEDEMVSEEEMVSEDETFLNEETETYEEREEIEDNEE